MLRILGIQNIYLTDLKPVNNINTHKNKLDLMGLSQLIIVKISLKFHTKQFICMPNYLGYPVQTIQ